MQQYNPTFYMNIDSENISNLFSDNYYSLMGLNSPEFNKIPSSVKQSKPLV